MNDKKRLNIEMDGDEYIALKVKATENGKFVSDVVRELIYDYLKDVNMRTVALGRKMAQGVPPQKISTPKVKQESLKKIESSPGFTGYKECKYGHIYKGDKCLVCK